MFSEEVKRISEDFIKEALQSPSLLEDMSAMEMYMAESYSNRTFIELLQNADDALSTRVFVSESNGNIYFANNGKPFDENDLMAICRSGASSKDRGRNIGYRGIGFKSTTYISNEILIYSNETYFSFSKSLCSKVLNKPEKKIPTVRIPMLPEKVDDNIEKKINEFKLQGYSTIFVFKKAKIQIFKNELLDITNGTYLFLNNICECRVEFASQKIFYNIDRFNDQGNKHVIINNSYKNEEWMLVNARKAIVAFKVENGVLVSCEDDEAVYHCYLPTIDKVLFPCKINADFSTDPSRKHITYDDRTEEAIVNAASLLFDVVAMAINKCGFEKYKNILVILSKHLSFSKINMKLENQFKDLVENKRWLKLNNGAMISAHEYKCIPNDYTETDIKIIREQSKYIKEYSLPSKAYEYIDQVDEFLRKYSNILFTYAEILSVISDAAFAEKVNTETLGRMVSNVIKDSKFQNDDVNVSTIVLPTKDGGIATIKTIKEHGMTLTDEIQRILSEQLMASDIDWLKKETGIGDNFLPLKEKPSSSAWINAPENIGTSKIMAKSVKPHITKWRDAEQKCIEIEEILGNKAVDVSVRNEGYDIESITPDGKKRYIEVKSVKKDWGFSLTNNEYTSASQYGDEYFICLLCENANDLKVRYLQNPLQNAQFEKRIRQWEWVCSTFESSELEFNVE